MTLAAALQALLASLWSAILEVLIEAMRRPDIVIQDPTNIPVRATQRGSKDDRNSRFGGVL